MNRPTTQTVEVRRADLVLLRDLIIRVVNNAGKDAPPGMIAYLDSAGLLLDRMTGPARGRPRKAAGKGTAAEGAKV